jgi:PKD repeat protein
MVEMALILPILALFLVMTVDFGRVFFSYIQITNAAREAAAFGASAPTNGAGITARANQEKNAQSQGGETAITVTWACTNPGGTTIPCASASGGTGAGNRVTVTVTEPFSFLTPLVDSIIGGGFTLSADATANVLGYAAGSGSSTTCTTAPTASFTVVVVEDLTVSTDPSASTPNSGNCNISGYNWAWGDGLLDPGGASSAQHTYANPGTYTITLQVTNPAGTHQTTQEVTVPEGTPIECDPPVAAFTISENGKIHTYRDASTVDDDVNCFITDWLWTFGNGTQSNAQNPAAVTYQNNGQHTTTLQVTNAGGTSTRSISH